MHVSLTLPVTLTVTFVCIALAAPFLGISEARYWFLVCGSLGFVTVAGLAGAWKQGYGRWVFAGLLFCLAGDILGPWKFAIGATMFLLAHCCFIAACLVYGVNRQRCLRSLVMLIPSALLAAWLLPKVDEELKWLIVTYTLVITVMVVVAGGTQRTIFQAAIVFYVSDIFLARWRFVNHDAVNAFICYPLYYTACLLFAVAVRNVTPGTPRSAQIDEPERPE